MPTAHSAWKMSRLSSEHPLIPGLQFHQQSPAAWLDWTSSMPLNENVKGVIIATMYTEVMYFNLNLVSSTRVCAWTIICDCPF